MYVGEYGVRYNNQYMLNPLVIGRSESINLALLLGHYVSE